MTALDRFTPQTGIVSSVDLDHPPAEVWAWHTRPGALRRLMPPFGFATVVSESTSLADGQAVLALPAGLKYRARHVPAGYDPPHRFVDEGVLPGPGSRLVPWRHEHRFSAPAPGRTRITDTVTTPLPRAVLAPMFGYRNRQLTDDLATHARMREFRQEPLTVAVTGASGTVGAALTALLTTGGHTVVRLVRRPPRGPGERRWHPDSPAPDLLDGVDAVVHLAGAGIAGRFTASHKRSIRASRVGPTAALAAVAGDRPFVCASAIGYYGPDRHEPVDETAARGDGFLAEVVDAWEADAHRASGRVVCVRTGLVMSSAGGLLALQRPLFAAGLGGRLGSGRQWWSWIALDDLIDIYYRALVDDGLSGPVNGVAPHPVQNQEWAATMGRVLRRPAVLPVPGAAPAALLGSQGAQELALAGQRVVPAALQRAGHHFRFEMVEGALRHELGREARLAAGGLTAR